MAENKFRYGIDYRLKPLIENFKYNAISPTYGAYTAYTFTVYQMFIERDQILLGPHDRWVTRDELLHGFKSSHRKPDSYLATLEKAIGDFDKLPMSLKNTQRRPMKERIKDRRWEITGIVLSAVGLLLAIVFWLFPFK
jgi:hypothetical protein